jgi:hypothetical protein
LKTNQKLFENFHKNKSLLAPQVKHTIFAIRNAFCFQSILRTNIVFNPKQIIFTQQTHLKTNEKLFKNIQQKSEFSCIASFQVFLAK